MTNLGPTPFPMPGTAQHDHPFAPLPADLAKLAVDLSPLLSPLLLPAPSNPTTIDPDDATVLGTAASGRAYADHQHQFTTAAPADLARSTASTEGVATTSARSDHVHDTEQMAWGQIPNGFFTSSSSSAAYAVNSTTDMATPGSIAVLNTRNYYVQLFSQIAKSNTGGWIIDFFHNAVAVDRFIFFDNTTAATSRPTTKTFGFVWRPASSLTAVADVRVTLFSGASTLTFEAGAGNTRQLAIWDIGPR